MGSNAKKKTTIAKLNRESKVREKRAEKAARKDARKRAAAEEAAMEHRVPETADEELVAD